MQERRNDAATCLPEIQDQTLVMEKEKKMLSCFGGISNSHFGSIH